MGNPGPLGMRREGQLDIRGHLVASNFLELVPKLPLHICSGGTPLKSLMLSEETVMATRTVVPAVQRVVSPSQVGIHKGYGGVGVVKGAYAKHTLREGVIILPATCAQV